MLERDKAAMGTSRAIARAVETQVLLDKVREMKVEAKDLMDKAKILLDEAEAMMDKANILIKENKEYLNE